jgi:RimJ/RimL family protein N-acetyltransferase
MPSIPFLAEPLSNGQVSLRLAAEWDIPEILIAHQDDPSLHVRLGEERPPTGAELGAEAERVPGELEAGTHARLTILQPGSDDCRGRVTAHKFDWRNRSADLGIWVAPQLRGRGIARAALRLAGTWLFDACRLERLQLLTDPDNQAMRRAALGAGFVEEGVLRSYGIEQGRRVDLAVLSLLPRDLEPR